MKGRLYIVPTPLGDNDYREVIPNIAIDKLLSVSYFAVEELRTARRYLSKIGLRGRIDTLVFLEINEHSSVTDIEEILKVLLEGNDIALISEAGLPAVADPGALLIELAHKNNIEVIPFVGPSSLMLALMSSGLNGQCFSFCGYIPAKTNERRAKLKELEKQSRINNQTQIFIETPYRNDSLLADILLCCDSSTRLTLAADLTLPTSYIKTKTIGEWTKEGIIIGKRPCVFLILA